MNVRAVVEAKKKLQTLSLQLLHLLDLFLDNAAMISQAIMQPT